MITTRREFIRFTALTGVGLLVEGVSGFGRDRGFRKFPLRIGVCTSLSNNRLFAEAGYAYIEEGVSHFLVPESDEEAFMKNLELANASRLPVEACNSFLPGKMKSTGNDAVPGDILKFAETAFRRAEMAGIKTIVFGSGGSRSIPDGFSKSDAEKQFVELGKRMGDLAGKYNVVVSLEPLNTKECNFINSVAEGGELVKRINHPNFRLLADIYHMLMEDESPDHLVEYGDLLYHIHIAEKENRAAPGVNGEDFSMYFDALKKAGYKSRMSIECRWKDQEKEAALAIQAIKNQF